MLVPARLVGALALVLLPLLAGCTSLSPEAQCFADRTIDYRAAWRGVQRIDADLARGYGVQVQEFRVAQAVTCRVGGQRGTCLGNGTQRLEIPVPIDVAVLQTRRAMLIERMDALRPAAMAASAPCGYGNRSDGTTARVTIRPP
jgi:hypothetical protein